MQWRMLQFSRSCEDFGVTEVNRFAPSGASVPSTRLCAWAASELLHPCPSSQLRSATVVSYTCLQILVFMQPLILSRATPGAATAMKTKIPPKTVMQLPPAFVFLDRTMVRTSRKALRGPILAWREFLTDSADDAGLGELFLPWKYFDLPAIHLRSWTSGVGLV